MEASEVWRGACPLKETTNIITLLTNHYRTSSMIVLNIAPCDSSTPLVPVLHSQDL